MDEDDVVTQSRNDWPFQPGTTVRLTRWIRILGSDRRERVPEGEVLTVKSCVQSEGTGSTWRVYFERIPGVIEDDTWHPAAQLMKVVPPSPPRPTSEDLADLEMIGNVQFGLF